PALDAEYLFTIAGSPIQHGTLWAYYWGYQYFESYKLADVTAGRAHVAVSAKQLEEGEPAPGDSGRTLLVALEVPGVAWYGPADFANVQALDSAIGSLGTARGNALRSVDLAAPVSQLLRLQNPDGSPRRNQQITLWAFETSIGHCARPTGFGTVKLTSD